MNANIELRQLIEQSGLKYYQVAYAYGVTDSNFSRLLRFELVGPKKEKAFNAVLKAKEMFREEV